MKINPIFKVLLLLISIHVYIFLTAFVYHIFEPKKTQKNSNVIDVLDKYFYKASSHGPRPNMRMLPSKEVVAKELENAFVKDTDDKISSEFDSLWKSYLFSLTTITTVGSSGLYLQAANSQLVFFFTSAIGTVLYIILLHHIAVFLLGILVQIAQFELLRIQNKPDSKLPNPFHASISVFLMSCVVLLLSILVIAIAVMVSGRGYLFGLCAVTDAALMIGNYHMLAYLYPWNEGGFVISINLMFLVCHSFLYTTVMATTHFVKGTKWEELVEMYIGAENIYKPVPQDEEKPYQKFLTEAGLKKELDAEAIESNLADNAKNIQENNLQKKKSSENGNVNRDPIVPTLLSPEDEDFWDGTDDKTGK